jgi:hypothetical protein
MRVILVWSLGILLLQSCGDRHDSINDRSLDSLNLRHEVLSAGVTKGRLYLKFKGLEQEYVTGLKVEKSFGRINQDGRLILGKGDSVIKPPFSDSMTIVHDGMRLTYGIAWIGDSLRNRALRLRLD